MDNVRPIYDEDAGGYPYKGFLIYEEGMFQWKVSTPDKSMTVKQTANNRMAAFKYVDDFWEGK
jgi:hypothetical protein